MVPALRVRRDKPVNERTVNTQFGQQFDSARLHFFIYYLFIIVGDYSTVTDLAKFLG